MAALQHATALTEVDTFIGCCDDIVRKGTQTLSVSAVCHRLDHLEAEWSAVIAQVHLTVAARLQALQHYWDVYNVCACTVPLPQTIWDRWATGITSSFPVADTDDASQVDLETLRAELVVQYWGLYCRLYWGCARAVRPRLAFAAEQAQTALTDRSESAAETSNSDVKSDSAPAFTVELLEQRLAAPLHAFARLAYDMSHLFGDYGVVGVVERQWLNEELLERLGDAAEPAVEALVRRSFKRDLHIPSASLPALLQEYEESEMEERKTKEIVTIGKATLESAWMRAAVTLHQHLANLSSASTRAAAGASGADAATQGAPLYDERAYALLEDLLKELRKAPHSRGCLPALGLLTHRVVEWQPSSSSSSWSSSSSAFPKAVGVGLSGSQLQFYLFLLHQWLARYIASQHRWSVTDMFNAADDSDLWSFVLDRHTFCLMWSLATFGPGTGTGTAALTSQEAQQSFMAAMDAKVDKLRSILYSVAHCLQLYRSSVMTFTNPKKGAARLEAARDAVHGWMTRVGVSTFCRGLLGDLLDTTEEWDDSNTQTPPLQLWTLNVEAELKLIMYDTLHLLDCPDNTTDRLETLVHVALDLCASWKEKLTEAPASQPVSTSISLFSSVVALVVRVIQRIRAKLQRTLDAASSLDSREVELYLKLVEWIKQLISVAGAFTQSAAMNAVWDEYLRLVSLPTPPLVTAANEGVANAGEARSSEVIPGFVSYVSSATTRAFGNAFAASGGIDDITWARRNVFKMQRKEREANEMRGARRNVPSSVDERAIDAAPVAKSARKE